MKDYIFIARYFLENVIIAFYLDLPFYDLKIIYILKNSLPNIFFRQLFNIEFQNNSTSNRDPDTE